jgi:hypothetical protein
MDENPYKAPVEAGAGVDDDIPLWARVLFTLTFIAAGVVPVLGIVGIG